MKTASANLRTLVSAIVAARSLAELAELVATAQEWKKQKHLTARELGIVFEFGAKKEAVLLAAGERSRRK